MSLVIPDDILHAANMTADEFMREIAIMLYQQERLSLGKAAEVARMDRFRFQQLLASRDIHIHYDIEDLDHDVQTLKELGRL